MRVRIEDETVIYEFNGERIAGPVSTRLDGRERQRARWWEASLWRKEDDTYVFAQASYSTVWHLLSGAGHVRKPAEVSRSQVLAADRPVYCGVLPPRPGREQCPPMELAQSRRDIPARVITECAQHRVWALPDYGAVIRRLTVARHRDGSGESAAVSRPMRELLSQAAANDPAFRTDGGKPVVAM